MVTCSRRLTPDEELNNFYVIMEELQTSKCRPVFDPSFLYSLQMQHKEMNARGKQTANRYKFINFINILCDCVPNNETRVILNILYSLKSVATKFSKRYADDLSY